jgi:hypothetical protein
MGHGLFGGTSWREARLRDSSPSDVVVSQIVWDQLRGHRGGGIDLSFVRVAKNNWPIGLNQDFQRKRSKIKRIGRLFSA